MFDMKMAKVKELKIQDGKKIEEESAVFTTKEFVYRLVRHIL